jgi:hypothetical protein
MVTRRFDHSLHPLSGEKATEVTTSVWPLKGNPTGWPLAASQTQTVWSKEPDAIRLPSGEKATDVTLWVWNLRGGLESWPLAASQT